MPSTQSTCLPTKEALSAADLSTLRAYYQQIEGTAAPKALKGETLRAHLAWTLQALQQKQKPVALRKRLLDQAQQSGHSPSLAYSPGTRLIREWQGQTHEVTILKSGYSYQGRHYRSLSGIATDITGAHWSWPRFFGVNKQTTSP